MNTWIDLVIHSGTNSPIAEAVSLRVGHVEKCKIIMKRPDLRKFVDVMIHQRDLSDTRHINLGRL